MTHECCSVVVGADVQSTAEVAESLRAYGARYTRKVFTEHEIKTAGSTIPVAAERLAVRFAAKEAVLKLLRPTTIVPHWRSIEVRRQQGGWPEIILTGDAAELARQRQIHHISVSMSHGGGVGFATVVAQAGNIHEGGQASD